MTHVEFVGPPGAGKTTLLQGVVRDPRFFGYHLDIFHRRFLAQGSPPYTLAYRALPKRGQEFVQRKFLRWKLDTKGFEAFLAQRPAFVPFAHELMQFNPEKPQGRFKSLRKAAARYELGRSVLGEGETLVRDEGFVFTLPSIAILEERKRFPLEEYFDLVPLPEVLVVVEAPGEECLRRQVERGRVITRTTGGDAVERLDRARARWRELVENLPSGIEVITVENVGPIESVVAKTVDALSKFHPVEPEQRP